MLVKTRGFGRGVQGGLLVALLCASLAAGCVTHTRFQTRPQGATLYLNGKEMGTTPVHVTSTRGLPKRYRVQLVKEGYEPVEVFLDNEMSVWWALCLGPAVVPLFWAWRLADGYEYQLKALDRPATKVAPATATTQAAPPPPPATPTASPPAAPPTARPPAAAGSFEVIELAPPPSAAPVSPPPSAAVPPEPPSSSSPPPAPPPSP